MTGTEVNTSSAWAERALAVLLLPFAFLVMVGGGAGMIWLWQDYRPQFWIGVCAIAVLGLLAGIAVSVASRQHRRIRWLSRRSVGEQTLRDTAEPPGTVAATSDSDDVLRELLSRVENIQHDLDVLMGEFTSEQERAGSGRHAGQTSERRSAAAQQRGAAVSSAAALADDGPPLMVDIRDDVDELDLGDDYDDLFGRDDFLDDASTDDASADDDQIVLGDGETQRGELGLIHTPDPEDPRSLDDDEPPGLVERAALAEDTGLAEDAELAEGAEPAEGAELAGPAGVSAAAETGQTDGSDPVTRSDADGSGAEASDTDGSHGTDSTGGAPEPPVIDGPDQPRTGPGLNVGGDSRASDDPPVGDDAEPSDVQRNGDVQAGDAQPGSDARPGGADQPGSDTRPGGAHQPGSDTRPGGADQPGDDGGRAEPGPGVLQQRRMRRLIRDRSARPQWDAVPAPRDPVQVIDLSGEGAGSAAGVPPVLEDDDEDEDDYFGADRPSSTEFRDRPPGSHREDTRDEYRSSLLGEDDDERPRDAR